MGTLCQIERSNRREKMVARTLSSLLLLLSCVQLAFCNDGVCTTSSPCDEAQGDCDTDEECNNGLVCGIDNCHTDFQGRPNISSLPSDADCCMQPRCDLLGADAWNCCGRRTNSTGGHLPCGDGQGDCDSDDDCEAHLICGINNCHKISGKEHANETMDCCMQPTCDASFHYITSTIMNIFFQYITSNIMNIRFH